MPPPVIAPCGDGHHTQQEILVELFAIERTCPDDHGCYYLHDSKLYPTRKSAEEAMAFFQAEAIVKEQEDWEATSLDLRSQLSDRIDHREHMFPEFQIRVMNLGY